MNEAEILQGRIVRLASGVAIIKVGGSTSAEMTERKHRIEDALEAVSSAQQEGIVPGGGVTLYRASRKLDTDGSEPQNIANKILQAACESPIRQMAKNAGESGDIILHYIDNSEDGYGWDFKNNKLVVLSECGIIDPIKVTRTALQNAVSSAGTLLTTKCAIIQTETN
mgnify:FL=1